MTEYLVFSKWLNMHNINFTILTILKCTIQALNTFTMVCNYNMPPECSHRPKQKPCTRSTVTLLPPSPYPSALPLLLFLESCQFIINTCQGHGDRDLGLACFSVFCTFHCKLSLKWLPSLVGNDKILYQKDTGTVCAVGHKSYLPPLAYTQVDSV